MSLTNSIRGFGSADTLDIPRARKVLEHLLAHPEEHNQATFGLRSACGTAACIAGTTLLQDPHAEIYWGRDMNGTALMVDGVDSRNAEALDAKAADLLGLSSRDARDLFYEYDNKIALRKLGDYIAAAEEAQHG